MWKRGDSCKRDETVRAGDSPQAKRSGGAAAPIRSQHGDSVDANQCTPGRVDWDSPRLSCVCYDHCVINASSDGSGVSTPLLFREREVPDGQDTA